MAVLNHFARFAAGFPQSGITSEIAEEVKLIVLDTIGAVLIGAETELGETIDKTAATATPGTASVLSTGKRAGILDAVRINSSMAHCAEIDCIHPKSIVCAAGMVVPAALAWAETKKLDGKSLIMAVAIGCETAIRLGKAAKGVEFLKKGWWPSSIFGPLGVCSSICRMEGFSEETTSDALAVCSTICGGLINGGVEGATARHYLFGYSARAGAEAAMAAASGITGPVLGLEGPDGLYASRDVTPGLDEILTDLGSVFHLNEILYKEFACAMQIQSGVHGFLELINREGIDEAQIKEVYLRLPERALVVVKEKGIPDSHTAAAAHGRYLIGAAMYDRDILPEQYETEKLSDKRILRFMERVHVIADNELDAWVGWPARVEIALNNGDTISLEVKSWLGDGFENRKEFVHRKFRRTMADVLPNRCTEDILDCVERLDTLDDIGILLQRLCRKDGDKV